MPDQYTKKPISQVPGYNNPGNPAALSFIVTYDAPSDELRIAASQAVLSGVDGISWSGSPIGSGSFGPIQYTIVDAYSIVVSGAKALLNGPGDLNQLDFFASLQLVGTWFGSVAIPSSTPSLSLVTAIAPGPDGTIQLQGGNLDLARRYRLINSIGFDQYYYDSAGPEAVLNPPSSTVAVTSSTVTIYDPALAGVAIDHEQARDGVNQGPFGEIYVYVAIPGTTPAPTSGPYVLSGISNNPGQVTLSGGNLLDDTSGPAYLFRIGSNGGSFIPDGFEDVFTGPPDSAGNPPGTVISDWTNTTVTITFPTMAGQTIDYVWVYDASATVGTQNAMATPIVVQA